MASSDDVLSQQAFVSSESTNVARGVELAADLDAGRQLAWSSLAHECLRFTSRGPAFGTVQALYTEGLTLIGQLAWWRASLEAMGVAVPDTDWSQAPHVNPPPGPGLGTLVWGKLEPALVLVALGLLVWGRRK